MELLGLQTDLFGPSYVDQLNGGRLTISVAGDIDAAKAVASSAVPKDFEIEWLQVSRSQADIDDLKNRLMSKIEEFSDLGVGVVSIGTEARENRVVLTIDTSSVAVGSLVAAQFGDAVEVVVGNPLQPVACNVTGINKRKACTPWRGGIYIYPFDGVGYACTWAFNVRSLTSATKYMLTAGHCGDETWRHNASTVGSTGINNLDTGSPISDALIAPLSTASTPLNLIYATDTDRSHAITTSRSHQNQLQGDYVCAAGVVSNYRCGYIEDWDYRYGIVYGGRTIYIWGKYASFRSDDGDSGGPVFNGSTALGLVSSKDGITHTAYVAIDLALQATGTRLCKNSSCS